MVEERYKLKRIIGTGGMAQVYEALACGDNGFQRRVAIKRCLPGGLSTQLAEQFVDEARIASRLHHGGIVQVLDYGTADGSEFMVMEYVEGMDASKAMRAAGQAMTEAVALHIVSEVADALAYVHTLQSDEGDLQLVHRDVSPHNILLSWVGDVKLADFGIAFSSDSEHKTQTGVVKGKQQYMAPEQARAGLVTSAADVYALGATLHALIVGRPPVSSPVDQRRMVLPAAMSKKTKTLVTEMLASAPEERPSAEQVAITAGDLAAHALVGAPRQALRDWLAVAKKAQAPASQLDALLNACIVKTQGKGRTFRVETAATKDIRPADDLSGSEAEIDSKEKNGEQAELAAPALATARRPWALLVGVASMALALWIGIGDRDAGAPIALASTSSDAGASLLVPVASGIPVAAVASASTLDAGVPATPARMTPEPEARVERAAASPPTAPPIAPRVALQVPKRRPKSTKLVKLPAPVEAVEVAVADGYLKIRGKRLHGASVWLDEHKLGDTPPLSIRTQVGRHRLRIVHERTGKKLLDETIVIKEHHSSNAPKTIQ